VTSTVSDAFRVDLPKLSLAKKKELLALVRQTVTVAEETPVPPVPAQMGSR
jgi:hypothetical protein